MSSHEPSAPPEAASRDSTPPEPTSFALHDLTWPEVRRTLDRDPRLLLAVGCLEQHGPHLPLGTNTWLAQRTVADLSREKRILRAPALRYGVGAPGGRAFAGTASLSRKTVHRTVNELLAAWEDHGVEELIIITAHRYEPHLDALLMALTSRATTTVVNLRSIPVNDLLDGNPAEEHGGELETSLLLYLDPDRVRRPEIRDFVPDPGTLRKYVRGRAPTPPPGSQGVVGSPSRASPEKGRRIYRRWVNTVRTRVLEEG